MRRYDGVYWFGCQLTILSGRSEDQGSDDGFQTGADTCDQLFGIFCRQTPAAMALSGPLS
jgi:hypothetical protein